MRNITEVEVDKVSGGNALDTTTGSFVSGGAAGSGSGVWGTVTGGGTVGYGCTSYGGGRLCLEVIVR